MSITTHRLVLTGLGNVGSSLVKILHREEAALRERYGVQIVIVGIAELGGCVLDPDGISLDTLLEAIENNTMIADLPDIGRPGMQAQELLDTVECDFLLEATPVNLEHGQPGLGNARQALQKGIHTILANKGPVAIAYTELAAMSDLGAGWGSHYNPDFSVSNGLKSIPKLRFSACVAGALPTINLGIRELAGCQIDRIEAVFNGTTQYILRAMEEGQSYADALADAQRRGIAETDPTLDVDGWDAAAKLVIAANSVLGQSSKLADMDVQGIRTLNIETVQQALAQNQRIVLVCLAERVENQYQLSVKPTPLPMDHPLCQLTPDEMAVVFYSQDVERLSVASSEPGPEPAAAAMLRDMLEIIRTEKGA